MNITISRQEITPLEEDGIDYLDIFSALAECRGRLATLVASERKRGKKQSCQVATEMVGAAQEALRILGPVVKEAESAIEAAIVQRVVRETQQWVEDHRTHLLLLYETCVWPTDEEARAVREMKERAEDNAH